MKAATVKVLANAIKVARVVTFCHGRTSVWVSGKFALCGVYSVENGIETIVGARIRLRSNRFTSLL